MTIEEAIEWMQEEKASFERAPDLNGCPMTKCWQKAIDVYDMAISALRQQDVTDKYVGKMTNAQKIRSMSDEELAEFLWNFNLADVSTDKLGEFGPHMFRCRLKEWLKQPAENDDHGV